MPTDPITEEIRAVRHKLAAQFGNDLSRILADVRRRQASDGRTYVRVAETFAASANGRTTGCTHVVTRGLARSAR